MVDRLDADRQPQEVFWYRCVRPSMGARCLTKLSTPPRDVASLNSLSPPATRLAAASPAVRRNERSMPNPSDICRAAMSWPGWESRQQTWVEDVQYGRLGNKPLSNQWATPVKSQC